MLESTSFRSRGATRLLRVLGLFSESLDLESNSVSEPDDDDDDLDDDDDAGDESRASAASSFSLDWDSVLDSEYEPLFLKCFTLIDPVEARVV